MSRPRFSIRKSKGRLLGRDESDWSSYASFYAPAFPDVMEVISLGDRYVASLGAHATHGHLVMDREGKYPLTVSQAHLACATLAFATDSPVVLQYSMTKRKLPDERAFTSSFRGGAIPSAEEYAEALSQVAVLAHGLGFDAHNERSLRSFTRRKLDLHCWWHYPWPENPAVARGLSAYSVGLLSVLAPSRILNFWRAIEAIVGPSLKARNDFFDTLETTRAAPVWAYGVRVGVETDREVYSNIVASLRRFALAHWRRLVVAHTSVELAVKHLYDMRRGKAAHADRVSLEFDFSADVAQQFADAALLRYAARVAIEADW